MPRRLGRVVAAHLVAVRRAQLALHLPHQIRELVAARDSIDQRQIAVVDGVPVDLGHVVGPELVALQTPRLAVHLSPLCARVDLDAYATQIEPAGGAAGRTLRRLLLTLDRGRHDANAVADAHRQRLRVGRPRDPRHAVDHRVDVVGVEIVRLEEALRSGRAIVAPAHAEASLDRPAHEQRAARDADDLRVAALVDRERDGAIFDPVEVDLHLRRAGLAFLLLLVILVAPHRLAGCADRAGLVGERRGRVPRQRDQHRDAALLESQVEVVRVVHRVEDALGKEVEVAALGIPRRPVVDEVRPGDPVDAAGRGRGDVNRPHPSRLADVVRQPLAVRRPRDSVDAVLSAPLDRLRPPGLGVDDDHFLALVRDRDAVTLGSDLHQQRASEVAPDALGPTGAGRVESEESLLAALVADREDRLSVARPAREAMAIGGRGTVPDAGALPQRHREQPASRDERGRVAVRVEVQTFEVPRRRNELLVARGTGASDADVEALAATTARVEHVEVGAGVVDDPPAVGLGETDVEVLVVRVAPQPFAVWIHRVEVAVALVVGEEPDARADPHRRREVARQVDQLRVLPVAIAIDPESAGGAAAVALPARRVAHVSPEDDARAVRLERDQPRRSDVQRLRRTAVDRDLPEVKSAAKRLARIAREDDGLPVRSPTHRHRVDAEPGQPLRLTALRVHQIDLAQAVVAARERQPLAVRRETGKRDRPRLARQSTRDAAADSDGPEVALGDEHDRVVGHRGVAIVAGRIGHGLSPPLSFYLTGS